MTEAPGKQDEKAEEKIGPSVLDSDMRMGKEALDGFDFQRRYALIWLIESLSDPDFRLIQIEGPDDVQTRFDRKSGVERQAVQVKDHRLTVSDVKPIISHFKKVHKVSKGELTSFVIACREIDKTLGGIRNAQELYRDYLSGGLLSRDNPLVANARARTRLLIKNAKLPHTDFVLDRVTFEPDLNQYSRAGWVKSCAVYKLQDMYPQVDRSGAEIIFLRLCELLEGSTARTVKRQQVEQTIAIELDRYPKEPTWKREEVEHAYLARVADDCRYLVTEGVDKVQAELSDVFVMLEAVESPPPQERTDVAPVYERAEEMGLPSNLLGHHGRRKGEDKPKQPEPPSPPPIPLSKALEEHRHLVILGEPGTGKSTALQYAALCLARTEEGWARQRLGLDEDRIPVKVDLLQYDGKERLDRFLIQWLERIFYVPQELAQKWLREGRLAVLLDGLHTVSANLRHDVGEAIKHFASSPKGKVCRIVVTSRIAGYQQVGAVGDFGHYTICPFTGPEDALPYTVGWLKFLKGTTDEEANTEARSLLREMEAHPGLRRVRGNPLLLRLALAVYAELEEEDQEREEIVHNRAEVYRRYVRRVVWKRAGGKEESPWSSEDIERAVEVIAWALQIHTERTETDLVEQVREKAEELSDVPKLVLYLRERLGLLAVYGFRQGDLIAFRHATFCEYFVAQRLARAWANAEYRESAWQFLQPRLHHPGWREPILLMAGMLKEAGATELVARITGACSPYERELRRDLLLAAAIIEDGAQVANEKAAQVGRALVRLYLDGDADRGWWLPLPRSVWEPVTDRLPTVQSLLLLPDRRSGRCRFSDLREQVLQALTGMAADPGKQVVETLVKALGDGDHSVGRAAAEVLGKIGKPSVGPLAQALGSKNSTVRQRAVEALGKIGKPALDALIGALSETDDYVRWKATSRLGDIGDARAVEALIGALEDKYDPVRLTAIRALGIIGDAQAVESLVDVLRNGDSEARWRAAEALGKIGDARAVKSLVDALGGGASGAAPAVVEALGELGEPAVGALVQVLEHGDSGESHRAIEALGRIGQPATKPLIQVLKDGGSAGRWRSAEALALIGDASAVKPLVDALGDDNRYVRLAAVGALGKIGDARAVEFLVDVLKSGDSDTRSRAAEALGKIGDAEAVRPLVDALADGDGTLRSNAVEALGKIGDAEAVNSLVGALADRDSTLRRRAVEALGKIGEPALRPLILALEDRDSSDVRREAAGALGKLSDARAVDALVSALGDEDSTVAGTAATALGKIGGPAVDSLIQALVYVHRQVRREAAGTLGEIGDARAVEPLIQALADSDITVRGAAAMALGMIGDARAVEPLTQALQDRATYVRWAAVGALMDSGKPAPEHLLPVLKDRYWVLRWAAARGLLAQVNHEMEATNLRVVARRLWWRLTDREGVAQVAYEALERTVAQLTRVEVTALGDAPPLFSTTAAGVQGGPSTAVLITLSILIAAILGVASSILAAYLQEQYALITDPLRLLLVVAVVILSLVAGIVVTLRLEKRSAKAA